MGCGCMGFVTGKMRSWELGVESWPGGDGWLGCWVGVYPVMKMHVITNIYKVCLMSKTLDF